MGNLNNVQLIGRLGQKPEVKYVGQNETAVCNISLATSEKYKSKSGEQVENTEWHNLTLWGRTAEILEQYCKSGSQIYIQGKLKTETWEDDDENTCYTTKIVVNILQLLDKPESSSDSPSKKKTGNKPQKGKKPPKGKKKPSDEYEEDDIPF